MTQEQLFIGFAVAYILFVLGFSGVLYQFTGKTLIVRLDPPSIDPPPLEYDGPASAGLDIDNQKELHIFHLAMVHLNGHCTVRALYDVVNKYHNPLYAEWPELKKLHINYVFIADTLKRRDINEPTGKIILIPKQLTWYDIPEKNKEVNLIPHILLTSGNSRVLVSVYHLAQIYSQAIPAQIPIKPVLNADHSPLNDSPAETEEADSDPLLPEVTDNPLLNSLDVI